MTLLITPTARSRGNAPPSPLVTTLSPSPAGHALPPLPRAPPATKAPVAPPVAVPARLAARDAPPAGARNDHIDRRARVDQQHDVRRVPRNAVDPADDALRRQHRHAAT